MATRVSEARPAFLSLPFPLRIQKLPGTLCDNGKLLGQQWPLWPTDVCGWESQR